VSAPPDQAPQSQAHLYYFLVPTKRRYRVGTNLRTPNCHFPTVLSEASPPSLVADARSEGRPSALASSPSGCWFLRTGAGEEPAEGDRQPQRVRVAWVGGAVASDLVDSPQSVAHGVGVDEQCPRRCFDR
jgi:hypothetical protein